MAVVSCMGAFKHRSGAHMYVPDRSALAVDPVIHIGYTAAMVVADTEP
jgi:hypothetical protein